MLALTIPCHEFKEKKIDVRIITRPVGPIQANCYLVADRDSGSCFLIDPGDDPSIIMGAIEAADCRLEAVLITHGHSDHLGATAEIVEETGAPVYGSSEVSDVLGSPDEYLLFPGMPSFKACKVDELLSGGEKKIIGGIEIDVIATPGHSTGSLTYFAADSLFCGDLLFHGSIGRTDLSGGSFEVLATSVKNLVLRYPADTVVYPGHGNSTTLEQEKENNPFLTDLGW
ncbi:MAG: MBL fold metallo-hydrolase [Thermoleophilia bacterium]